MSDEYLKTLAIAQSNHDVSGTFKVLFTLDLRREKQNQSFKLAGCVECLLIHVNPVPRGIPGANSWFCFCLTLSKCSGVFACVHPFIYAVDYTVGWCQGLWRSCGWIAHCPEVRRHSELSRVASTAWRSICLIELRFSSACRFLSLIEELPHSLSGRLYVFQRRNFQNKSALQHCQKSISRYFKKKTTKIKKNTFKLQVELQAETTCYLLVKGAFFTLRIVWPCSPSA